MANTSTGAEWDCEAYGPEGRQIGALCFLAADGARVCASATVCHRTMAAERQRVFGRIQEGARAGDLDMIYLASQFPSPDTLLGGGE